LAALYQRSYSKFNNTDSNSNIANGLEGNQTPEAVQQRISQPAGGSDPFAALVDHVRGYIQTRTQQPQPQPPSAGDTLAPAPMGPQQQLGGVLQGLLSNANNYTFDPNSGAPDLTSYYAAIRNQFTSQSRFDGGEDGGGPPIAQEPQPIPAPSPTPTPSPAPAPSTPGPGDQFKILDPTPPDRHRAAAPPPNTPQQPQIGPKPSDGNNYGLSDWAWSTANDWYQKSKAQGYGDAYSWLLEKPWVLDMYKSFVDASPDRANIDPVDYIHFAFPDLNNPGYKRAGYDTMTEKPDGTPIGPTWNTNNPEPPPDKPLQYGAGFLQQQREGIANKTIDPKSLPDDLLTALGYTPQQIADLRKPPAQQQQPTPDGGGHSNDPVTPPAGATPPPAGTQPAPSTPPPSPFADSAAAALESLRADTRKRAELQLAENERELRAKSALVHGQSSGAFESSLASQFGSAGADLAQALSTLDYESFNKDQDRKLQDNIARLNADTTRYGVDTTASTQRYNTDTSAAVQREGYANQLEIAKIQQAAQEYGARMGAQAAAAGASASQAAAAAQAAEQKYEADLRYKLGLYQTDVQREGNYLGFTGNQSQQLLDWIKTIMQMSPDNFINNAPWPIGNIIPGRP
jgi:hypothetical protein